MVKVSVLEASQLSGMSTHRIYSLVKAGKITGQIMTINKKGQSWADKDSLIGYKPTRSFGRPPVPDEGDYLSIRTAAQKIKYSIRHLNLLINEDRVKWRQSGKGKQIHLPSLKEYIKKAQTRKQAKV